MTLMKIIYIADEEKEQGCMAILNFRVSPTVRVVGEATEMKREKRNEGGYSKTDVINIAVKCDAARCRVTKCDARKFVSYRARYAWVVGGIKGLGLRFYLIRPFKCERIT